MRCRRSRASGCCCRSRDARGPAESRADAHRGRFGQRRERDGPAPRRIVGGDGAACARAVGADIELLAGRADGRARRAAELHGALANPQPQPRIGEADLVLRAEMRDRADRGTDRERRAGRFLAGIHVNRARDEVERAGVGECELGIDVDAEQQAIIQAQRDLPVACGSEDVAGPDGDGAGRRRKLQGLVAADQARGALDPIDLRELAGAAADPVEHDRRSGDGRREAPQAESRRTGAIAGGRYRSSARAGLPQRFLPARAHGGVDALEELLKFERLELNLTLVHKHRIGCLGRGNAGGRGGSRSRRGRTRTGRGDQPADLLVALRTIVRHAVHLRARAR